MPDLLRDQVQTSLGTAYTLERELGGGGMSRVFVAREEALGRDVVVKVLAPELAAGLSAERFAREIRLAAALQAPHIVPVLAAGVTSDGLPYYTMPFVRGASLRQRMVDGSVPLGEAVAILRDVATALEYAHGQGLVHRDIKPENVLLSGRNAVVTDFGIAKALSASKTQAPDGPAGGTLTQLGTSLGTPAYMAPEQAAGDAVDVRADVYAWGLMAYELLAGRHPFAGKTTAHQLIAAQITEAPASLGGVARGVSPAFAALVMRCLAKDPAERPADGRELLAALDAVPGAPPGAAPQAAAARRRGALLGVAAVALLAAGAGVYAWRAPRGPDDAVPNADGAAPLRLAVLPFDNAGPAEEAVFADGLTDAVTAKLGALPALAVVDRHSAAQYRNTTKPAIQIGTELGVLYLLEGVVRWARDPGGPWKAQVTPTLVDAHTGTTKWTGDAQVITPTDPFTAQGRIATRVAEALALQLRPADAAGLARRMTNDPEAFAAYTRGLARWDAIGRTAYTAAGWEQMRAEFAHAVERDSTFADAWAYRAISDATVLFDPPPDVTSLTRRPDAVTAAAAHAPGHPLAIIALAMKAYAVDHDTTAADTLARRAAAVAGNDATALTDIGYFIQAWDPERADALKRRAAVLDPRSAVTRYAAAGAALPLRRWDDARGDADALVSLDSTDERGWEIRLIADRYRGDTLARRRDVALALALVPRPTSRVLMHMAHAGEPYATRFLALTPRDLGVGTLDDSVVYYDAKADALAARGDERAERAYRDSVRALLRRSPTRSDESLLVSRALADAALGDGSAARREIAELPVVVRRWARRRDLADAYAAYAMAATYARLAEPDSAVRWLEVAVSGPTGWTARGLAAEPKFRTLRGVPAFERFLRAHPE